MVEPADFGEPVEESSGQRAGHASLPNLCCRAARRGTRIQPCSGGHLRTCSHGCGRSGSSGCQWKTAGRSWWLARPCPGLSQGAGSRRTVTHERQGLQGSGWGLRYPAHWQHASPRHSGPHCKREGLALMALPSSSGPPPSLGIASRLPALLLPSRTYRGGLHRRPLVGRNSSAGAAAKSAPTGHRKPSRLCYRGSYSFGHARVRSAIYPWSRGVHVLSSVRFCSFATKYGPLIESRSCSRNPRACGKRLRRVSSGAPFHSCVGLRP